MNSSLPWEDGIDEPERWDEAMMRSNEPQSVGVIARHDADGTISPLSVLAAGRQFPIDRLSGPKRIRGHKMWEIWIGRHSRYLIYDGHRWSVIRKG